LALLAARTKMRPALRYQYPANRRSACDAWLPRSAVDPVLDLKEAPPSIGIYIGGNRGAAFGDCFREDLYNGFVQAPHAVFPQPRSNGQRMNTCSKQSFIRIDIADASQKHLVQEHRFDPRFAFGKPRCELGEFHLQRLRTQPGNSRRQLRGYFEAAQPPRVIKQQHSAVESEDRARIRAGITFCEQPARHAEVDGNKSAAFQFEHNELTAPVDASNLAAYKHPGRSVRICPHHETAPELGRQD